MLTIPDEVKALFSSDTVHKNFHVHFPNGETTDLNNENVISESVTFTESLCSQQYFKFGLAEASQIEFIAVGIPNIRGVYIEAAIEIDCTSLGDEWAEDNPIDPTLDFLTPQTCNYDNKLYYRVPYGRFKVDTCPRDHGAMWQRQITAYSDMLSNNVEMNLFERTKLNTLIPYDNGYNPNMYLLFIELINRKQVFDGAEWENTTLTPPTRLYTIRPATVYLENEQHERTIELQSGHHRYYPQTHGISDSDLFTIQTERNIKNERREIFDFIKNDMEIDWQRTIDASDFSNVDDFINDLLHQELFLPTLRYVYNGNVVTRICIENLDDIIYPKIGSNTSRLRFAEFFVTTGFYNVLLGLSPASTHIVQHFDYEDGIALTKHTFTAHNIFNDMTMSFNSTLKSSVYYSTLSASVLSYSFANAFSLTDFVVGQLEICGWFLKPNRSGELDFFQMSTSPATIPVSRSYWAEFWWDETPIDAIGKVRVIYATGEDDQDLLVTIGSGNSIYTIDNNEVLASSNWDEATIQSILNTYFKPNASVVNFTPVDLEMRGLPYLESGDYIQLTAEDGTQVETYILSQTISGIQHLTATVTSTNGELLEVIGE